MVFENKKNIHEIHYKKRKHVELSPVTKFPIFIGQGNQNVQVLEIEKLKLENRKLHEEIQKTKLE